MPFHCPPHISSTVGEPQFPGDCACRVLLKKGLTLASEINLGSIQVAGGITKSTYYLKASLIFWIKQNTDFSPTLPPRAPQDSETLHDPKPEVGVLLGYTGMLNGVREEFLRIQ